MTTKEITEIMMALEELGHTIDRSFEKAQEKIKNISIDHDND